jgi:hypothetical protein
MAGVTNYQEIVKQLLDEYAGYPPSTGEIEMQTIFDEARGRYLLMAAGWQSKRRVHGCVIHIDIRGDKIWLQHDSTDAEIARQLVERGIPQSQIVIGFQPERLRQYTGFAVN